MKPLNGYYVASSGEKIPVKILSRKGALVRMRYTGKSRAFWTRGEIFEGSKTHVRFRRKHGKILRRKTKHRRSR